MMGLNSEPEEQVQAIMVYLGLSDINFDNLNAENKSNFSVTHINQYIGDNIHREKYFYVVEADFWNIWIKSTGDKFQMREQIKTTIDNAKLLEPGHCLRLKDDMTFKEDFIIVPKYVFKPLSKWYDCNKVIERSVLELKIFQNIMRSTKNKDSSRRPSMQGFIDHTASNQNRKDSMLN